MFVKNQCFMPCIWQHSFKKHSQLNYFRLGIYEIRVGDQVSHVINN